MLHLTFADQAAEGPDSHKPQTPHCVVTGRLKPAHEVFHQLMHDEALQSALGGPEAILVGHLDRFLGVLECPLQEFASLEIPFHRVRHYRSAAVEDLDGLIWDRERRINNICALKEGREHEQEG